MNFPENVKYAKSHEWLRLEGNTGYIGITDFAQSELGDVVYIDITANVGDELNAGDVFGSIDAVKTVSDVYMPVSGKIVEINSVINDSPESVNSDPFGEGWMIKIEVSDPDTSKLMDSAAYSDMVGHAH
jgi:glycine cleavage system H protein